MFTLKLSRNQLQCLVIAYAELECESIEDYGLGEIADEVEEILKESCKGTDIKVPHYWKEKS